MRQGELIKLLFLRLPLLFAGEAEGHERQALAVSFRHDDESKLAELVGEVVCRLGEVTHDVTVAGLAESDELIVLPNDLGRALGEVEREGSLLGAEVVDVENQVFREVFGRAPDYPAHAGIYETILGYKSQNWCFW